LERSDKWFLGGGRTLIYAPPFPQHLQTPGFWDEAHLLDLEHARPYTYTILDEDGREIPLKYDQSTWMPDRLHRAWKATERMFVVERACCCRDDTLATLTMLIN